MYNQYQEWDTVTYAKAQIQNDQDKLHLSDSVGFSVLHPSWPAYLQYCPASPLSCIHPLTHLLASILSLMNTVLHLPVLHTSCPVTRQSCLTF